jgi:hypothetical protein
MRTDRLQNDGCLGTLAMQFRSTRQPAERHAIARAYAESVDQLIQGGAWEEMPGPEDQLPDDWMPKAFFDYWLTGR